MCVRKRTQRVNTHKPPILQEGPEEPILVKLAGISTNGSLLFSAVLVARVAGGRCYIVPDDPGTSQSVRLCEMSAG